jgi:hypothetical protein
VAPGWQHLTDRSFRWNSPQLLAARDVSANAAGRARPRRPRPEFRA